MWLLGSRLPLRILLLADLDLGLAEDAHLEVPLAETHDSAANLGLLALAQRGACIAQSSLGAPEHLAESLEAAFDFPGPALLHVHAPSPQRHGFEPARTPERARQALAARVLPLFRYDPRREGVFGSRISLDGNPHPESAWATEAFEGEEQVLTPAHWALGERRFAGLFALLDEGDPDPLPLTDWLALAEAERAGKTPYVIAPGAADAGRLRVDPRLARISGERQHAWRTLQELAGVVTPFTARVRAEAEAAVAAERQTERAALKADYEARLQRLRDEQQEAIRHDMRERLLQLAGYGPAPEEPSQ
jgi:pyruvate-ferredoxin/flavodoxin oxidoreductase